jgi:murein DD-endopeptidase MepM/ murein hydrolase activator NlpD
MVVRVNPGLGTTYAILDGLRIVFEPNPKGPRALMPIPVTAVPGPTTLGIELVTRRGGRERIPMDVAIGARTYAPREVVVPDARRALLSDPQVGRQSRLVLEALRTHSDKALWSAPFAMPALVAPSPSFGSPETFVGGDQVDSRMDCIFGEYHRGLDFQVPAGVAVTAPGSGTVILAQPLVVAGETLVLDHGQGVVSAFFHLGRIDVQEGSAVEVNAPLGAAGDTGISGYSHVHWGVYLHGVAVDPLLLSEVLAQ